MESKIKTYYRAVIPKSNAARRNCLTIYPVEGKIGRQFITETTSGLRYHIIADMDVNGNFYHQEESDDGINYRLYETEADAIAYHRQYALYLEYVELTRNQVLRDTPVSVLETVLCVLRKKDTAVQTEQPEPETDNGEDESGESASSRRCPCCGGRDFIGHQVIWANVSVEIDTGLFSGNLSGGLEANIYDSESPYGPFTCANCGYEVDELAELEEGEKA